MSTRMRHWLALAALCLGMAMLYMNTTMVTQALPVLSTGLGASATESEWIVASYNLVFLAALLPGGALGDKCGHRRILLAGITVFGICAAVSLVVSSPVGLILTRGGMGLGASAFTPMSLALISHLFDGFGVRARALATSIWTVSGMLGTPLGPLVGGLLVDFMGWQGIFILDAVLCAVVLTTCWWVVPRIDQQLNYAPIAWLQAGTSACAFLTITWALVVSSTGWNQLQVWLPLGVGLALFATFLVQEERRAVKLTNLALFKRTYYSLSALTLGVINLILFGVLFITPTYFQTVLGYSATVGGLLLVPSVVTAVIGSLVAAKTIHHARARTIIMPCVMVLIAIGCALASRTSPTSPTMIIAGLAIAGLGLGAGQSFAFSMAMEDIDATAKASASALLNAVRQLGALLGTAVVGSMVSTIQHHIAPSATQGTGAAGYVTGLAWTLVGCAVAALVTGLLLVRLSGGRDEHGNRQR